MLTSKFGSIRSIASLATYKSPFSRTLNAIEEKEEPSGAVIVLPASIQSERDVSTKLWSVMLEDNLFEDASIEEFNKKIEKLTVYLNNGKLLEGFAMHESPGKLILVLELMSD
jgi:hypothetical protein